MDVILPCLNEAPALPWVLGRMPAGFRLPGGADLLTPLVFTAEELRHRGAHYLVAMGKLKPGATTEQARTEMSGIATALTGEGPPAS